MSRLIPARPCGMTSPGNRPRRHLGGAELHQLLAAMQRQDRLLLFAFHATELLNRSPDRPMTNGRTIGHGLSPAGTIPARA